MDDVSNAAQFQDFFRILLRHQEDSGRNSSEGWRRVVGRLVARLSDHQEDLHAMLTDRQLLQDIFAGSSGIPKKSLEQLVERQTMLKEKGLLDFADAGLLVRLLQIKGVAAARPGYAHVMVDEAQDLSQVELATLLAAADERQCVTMCGDMAQKIKGEVTFATPAGFAHFIQEQQEKLGAAKVRCRDLHGRIPGHPAHYGGGLEDLERTADYGSGPGRPRGTGGAHSRAMKKPSLLPMRFWPTIARSDLKLW